MTWFLQTLVDVNTRFARNHKSRITLADGQMVVGNAVAVATVDLVARVYTFV